MHLKSTSLIVALGLITVPSVHGLPVEVIDSAKTGTDLTVRTTDDSGENSLAIRDPGSVALYSRNDEAVKMNAMALQTGVKLATIGVLGSVGCVFVTGITGGAGAAPCLYGVAGVIGSVAIASVVAMKGTADVAAVKAHNVAQNKIPGGKLLRRTDEPDPNDPNNIAHYYTATHNETAVQKMQKAYNGSEMLVAHSHCKGAGCHEYWYSNAYADHPNITTIHRLSRKPRQGSQKRAVNNGGLVPGSSSIDENAGNEDNIYAMYSFWDIAPVKFDEDQTSSQIPAAINGSILGHVDALGLYCANVHDIGIGGKDTQATAGVISFQLNGAYAWGSPLPTDGNGGTTPVLYDEQGAITKCQAEPPS